MPLPACKRLCFTDSSWLYRLDGKHDARRLFQSLGPSAEERSAGDCIEFAIPVLSQSGYGNRYYICFKAYLGRTSSTYGTLLLVEVHQGRPFGTIPAIPNQTSEKQLCKYLTDCIKNFLPSSFTWLWDSWKEFQMLIQHATIGSQTIKKE